MRFFCSPELAVLNAACLASNVLPLTAPSRLLHVESRVNPSKAFGRVLTPRGLVRSGSTVEVVAAYSIVLLVFCSLPKSDSVCKGKLLNFVG